MKKTKRERILSLNWLERERILSKLVRKGGVVPLPQTSNWTRIILLYVMSCFKFLGGLYSDINIMDSNASEGSETNGRKNIYIYWSKLFTSSMCIQLICD
uniref:Uncharacterized protein n=1 Tax=Manihot esculenta TaxID=3983 RepID=A0A2C9UQI6_MANES